MYEPIAIVGTACRFPGSASTPSKLWDLLKAPRDVLKSFAQDRLGTQGYYNSNGDMRGRSNVLHKSYLLEEDTRHFDNAFFHINPKDAAEMDPQQRMLLETVYEAFEAAGLSLEAVDNSQTSVHVGVMTDDYQCIQSRDPDTLGGHAATGVSRSILANRISYAFNLQGASLALDTACSSSLVALHMAVQGLQRGEATQAVVAGTNLLMDSTWYIMASSMHMISTESRCRMWDRDASGYARGEGVAAVVLKTLSQAIADNDRIECIIRGTGVNSDGQGDGRGITIPSPAAQTALIQSTYRAAGLDPVADRCQYFECHGTGTQAGDPAEAQAIRDAFHSESEQFVLYCGSIKTVIGHLEGCAGLAGVIKASLAIQNKTIPPNMHFNNLSPKVAPFYDGLQVPTTLIPWPETGKGPRRASVNSFGFGGTNAHAILESYEPSTTEIPQLNGGISESETVKEKLVGPFVFSARSQASLVSWLQQLVNYLRVNESVDLDTLASTLHSRRSVFRYRTAIPTAVDQDDLVEKLTDQINMLNTANDGSPAPAAGAGIGEGGSILGVFTGQGAQAPQMGYALFNNCASFRESILECERVLVTIPDPPSWSLSAELSAAPGESHVSEARFSQPLCTAIQIALVDLLRLCGVRFRSVVGHSSGEIGAAYAAGLLSRRDAMGISYYRGCVSNLARGENGQPGSMMAVSISRDAATELCAEQQFQGRVTVAASNSPSSVTLSGDRDAIVEMKSVLDERQVQARVLQVDTAYHSHHMRACAEPYLQRLKELGGTIQTPPADQECRWYSSVQCDTDILQAYLEMELDGAYWVQNLVQPVLFSEAVTSSVQGNGGSFSTAIEVGPHATLKGPVNQTLKQSSIPYTSCLSRGQNAMETFSEALTALWTLAPTSVHLSGWCTALSHDDSKPPIPLSDLPPYAWDHTQTHWRESRVSRSFRLNPQPTHDLLGRLWQDTGSEHTWRNTLRLEEMPWLRGHVFQSQILFPATGYVSLAVDAAKVFAKGQGQGHGVKLIEVRDMTIPTALPINEGDEIEILFTIRSRGLIDTQSSTIEAEFTCHSYARSDEHVEADKNCQGQLTIHLGDPAATNLPPTSISKIELTPCNVDRFYQAASEIGFAYSGPFRGLETLNKCWGHAKGVAVWDEEDPDMQIACTLHPAITDVAFQTGLSNILSMAERSMHSPYLPVGIKRAVIDPNQKFGAGSQITIEAYLTSPTVGLGPQIETDISVKSMRDERTGDVCEIQLEGVAFKALSEQLPSEDRNMYAKTVWGHDAAYGLSLPPASPETERSMPSYTAEDYERVALFHLRRLSDSVTPQDMHGLQPHHQRLVRCINEITANIRGDTDRGFLKAEWLLDTPEAIADLVSRNPTDLDMVALLSSVALTQSLINGRPGGQKPNFSVYQGLSTRGTGCSQAIAQLVAQISHTFPRTNILHLCGDAGSGTIETVTGILGAVGDAFAAYTCTSPSQNVVDELKSNENLAAVVESGRFSFDVFDPEDEDAIAPGKKGEPYDVIIVTDLCRARKDLPESIRRIRSLLRPGGFLISTELTGMSLVTMAMLGGVDGWWENGDKASCPAIKTGELDDLLSNNGFFGIDTIFHDQPSQSTHGYSVLAAQAVDDRLAILGSPLTALHAIPPAKVVIIGGETSRVSSIVRQGKNLFRSWSSEIQAFSRFDTVDVARVAEGCSVINLQDLDRPLFSTPPSVNELKNLQQVLGRARNILWVTSGRLVEDPYANIMAGIGRALYHEHVDLNLQFLDFDHGEPVDSQTILIQFLRLVFSNSSPSVTEGMLWVREPELVVRNGQMVTPRVLLDTETNDIFNADRRKVVRSISSADPIEIVDGGSSEARITRTAPLNAPEGHVQMQVELSVALHVNGEAPHYLSYGHVNGGRPRFALSDTDSSAVAVSETLDYEAELSQKCDAAALVNVATFLLASDIVSRLPSSGTTVVSGASNGLSTALATLAGEADKKIVFVTLTGEKETPESLVGVQEIHLHPQSPVRIVKRLLPRDANALFDLSSNNSAAFIAACLPSGSRTEGFDAGLLSQDAVQEAVNIHIAHPELFSSLQAPIVLSLADISQKRTEKAERLSVVTNWSRSSPVNAVIRGLDPHTLISPNKTYFLVGMAGELGQSLAYFLVRSGARYIVLSSRNPKDNQHWLQDLRSVGIDIRMVKMDVTDRSQVLETVKHLRATMPPIGGVTNAALVLEPGVFGNLSAASIAKQMMPKIHGTVHLDEAFADGPPLDFFMCFGSLGTTIGNPGHAIYHAGNAFMLSLVANRKRRGLAGSILNFGMLVDVGYVARADRSEGSNVEEWLRTDGLIALSEADFHHVILQGIAAGKPGSGSHEVIMGVEMFHDKGQATRPRWVGSSHLSHMVRKVSDANEGGAGDASASRDSHQFRLEAAATVEEAIAPVTELLSQKIKAMIHVSLDSIHGDEPLSRLGIDSINAIEIRKWLWERLQVEIPMVKILGRDPSASIIRSIAAQYLDKRPERVDSKKPGAEVPVVAAKVEQAQAAKDEPTAVEQALSKSQSSLDGKASSTLNSWEIVPESPVSSLSSESALEFTRSERLSFSQSGLFYIHAFSESRTSLNLTTRWKIKGPLDVERLAQAFQKTVNRHDALRTCFFVAEDSSEVQQYLTRTKEFRLTRLQSSPETADADAHRTFDNLKAHEYSIETGETLRVILLQHGLQSHTLILGIHNLAVDVVSIMMILKEIGAEYQSPSSSQSAPTLSYFDYTRQQREDVLNGRLEASIEYWTKHLDPIPDPLPLLPVARVRARQSTRAYGHHHVTREVSSEFVAAITAIGQAHGDVTPMQFYLAALQVFLRRLLNLDTDIVIGVVHSGRDGLSKFRETVGHMATILPIRFKGALDKKFPEVLQSTRTTLVDSLDHAHIPFALIVDKVVRHRPGMSAGNMPLIQVGFDYMANVSLSGPLGKNSTIALEDADFTTVYDLVLDIQPSADGKGGHILGITCSDDYYSRSATEFLAEAFVNVLHGLVQEPLSLVGDYKIFSDAQLDNAKTVARSTPPLSHSWPESLVERFAQVAAQFPDSVAIKDGDQSITYSQLIEKVELYAAILLAADARGGTSRVAVLCKPSIDLYAAMLAVYWIGAVFVPLDASVPAARRNAMMKACQPRVLVFHPATADEVAEKHLHLDTGSRLSLVNITMLARTHRQSSPPPMTIPSDSGADSHLLFTSGSTGVPKGIRLHQRGIMNFAAAVTQRYSLGQVRVLQQTSIGFDVGFSQIYTALTNGGTLVVAPLEARGDPDRLSRLILDNKVQWTMCTPSEYSLMLTYAADRLRQCTEWRFAGAGGEVLSDRVVDGLRDLGLPHLLLTNWYGPTEVTVITAQDIPLNKHLSDKNDNELGSTIGRVLPNNAIYIASENDGTLLPVGMPGEICVAGNMVANGYLDTEFNVDTFIENPFTAITSPTDNYYTNIYKTGDKGIMQQDGSITFLGRTARGSTVIKLRGLRIDLDEVSGAILAAAPEDLAEAAVTVRGGESDSQPQFLVCHVSFKPVRHIEYQQLVDLVQRLPLPRYMIPATIVVLDRMPLVPNGKLDRELLKTLPLPATAGHSFSASPSHLTNGIVATLTEAESTLRTLWIRIIGAAAATAEIGPHSSFLSVGGNSFLLVHLKHLIRREMGVDIPLPQLAMAVDLRVMAGVVER